ncbi:DUF1775 domain-containing protein [Paractinoplanes toevensis]|uniref:YncI copper-binding domain-containing protein n=1 Tax=Paractinoplanes toevensis TaxID=571911 RepID=A0A919W6K7_9ACTN|nr:DUF1775 domain-containing protein [Actinoplanes toevensis]GIM94835.1 hypothetical protein Ato02nite_066280 [Actinoplanes toevensis]
MRFGSRVVTVVAVAGFAVLGLAGPALAHVEVSADKTTAGAENVTLTFDGEAESDDAGIASERVVLPTGIAPSAVTLVKAPAGWTFTPTADGFTVGGKALKAGVDAVWKVKIAKLPDGETRLSFKTLETYSDGEVARWIEIQEQGKDEPDNPAPLVTLKPGPSTAPATSAAPTSAAPSVEPSAVATTTPVSAEPADDDGGSTWWIWVIVVVVLAAVAGFVLLRRGRSGSTDA